MDTAHVLLEGGKVLAALHLLEEIAFRGRLACRKRRQCAMSIEQFPDFLGPGLDVCG